VVGPQDWILYPALVAMALTVLFGTPARLFGLALPEPVFPMVLAFAWPLIRPSVLAPIAVLLCGLFLDLMWGGTLGLWPVVMLGVYGVVLGVRGLILGQETLVLFFWYAGATAVAYAVAWAFVTMDAGAPPSIFGGMLQAGVTIALFPAANYLLQRFDDDVRFR
jgi:rod shape-determining protein MreD